MNSLFSKVKLSRQAMLFDSYLYVLKGFLSILTGYVLFHSHPIIGKDMISMLFGMMMTLEPSNIIGIKSGLSQIKATILGGAVSAFFVMMFGVNALTISLAVALTMYISLKFNWRFVSPVAIFTAIYMTQYIQLDALGDPSMLLTLRLRLMALGAGVAVAVLYNFVFSKFFHNRMLKKRIVYVVESLSDYLNVYIRDEKDGDLKGLKSNITGLFADIDLVISHLTDFSKMKTSGKTIGLEYEKYGQALSELRDFTHYLLDVIMFRMKHDKGTADLEILASFRNTLIEIKNVVLNLSESPTNLSKRIKEIEALNIKEESYLSAMHLTVVQAGKLIRGTGPQ